MSMNIQNKDFIFTTFGVSGREDKVREEIETFVEPLVDEILLLQAHLSV
jgi:hypothetical protein